MKSFISLKQSFFVVACLSIGLSAIQTHAFMDTSKLNPFTHPKLTARRITFLGGLVSFGRLATKEKAKEDRLTLDNALEKFKKAKPLSKKWFKLLVAIWDDVVVGFKGKEGGKIKPVGSSLYITGEEKQAGVQIMPDGTKIELRKFEGQDPYGVMGVLWANAKPVWGMMKDLKDGKETFDYWAQKANICN